jgi:hypothetical protein
MKMQLKYHPFIFLLLTAAASGCLKNDVDLPVQKLEDYNKVYMPQAVNSPVVSTLLMKPEEQTLVYGANYGGYGYPDQDITVNFAVAPNMVDSFNLQKGTAYTMMPTGSYTLTEATATIAKGALSTKPLELKIKTEGALDLFKEYLLPVTASIGHAGATVQLNNGLATTYYLVKASLNLSDFPDYDRSKWTIAGFSTEEANGEGADNGHAKHAIDNNKNTFWHSQWSGGSATAPYSLWVNLNETKTIHGISFTDRQNSGGGRPLQVTVQTSTNGTNWEDAGIFNLASTNDQQRFFFVNGFKEASFIKIIVTSTYDGASYTHLAELAAF